MGTIQNIQKYADRLSFIVEDLLSLSRFEQEDEGKTIKLQEGYFKDVFQSDMQICRSKAEEKNITSIPSATSKFPPTGRKNYQ